MCARYGSATEFNWLEKKERISLPKVFTAPDEIIYPHRPAPVIIEEQGELQVRILSYSLVPSWSKDKRPKFATYNARVEEVLNKPSWREPFKSKHCIVPVKFFIESVYTGPYAGHNIAIEAKDHRVMTAAGIWDTWIDKKTGEVVDSFAILTSAPPEDVLSAGHDRCPIFLDQNHWRSWIHETHDGKEWVQFLEKNRAEISFEFHQREALKSFNKQLSLLGDSD